MKALVLKQIGALALEDCPEPILKTPQDAIVKVTAAGICGSDLHIVHGRDPGVKMGTIMGHEFTGVVTEVGKEVTNFKPGDRVVSPFTTNCGECFFCKRDLPARCLQSEGFGFITENGRGLHGAQAEAVRVPLSSSTLMRIPTVDPPLKDEEVLFLGDIFSTAYSCAEGGQIKKGDVVVVVGCGPVGLLSILAAKTFEPSAIIAIDSVNYRLAKARQFGAHTTEPDPSAAWKLIAEFTSGRGADAVLEAVGNPSALDLAIHLVRAGGVVSIAGYHTEPSYPFPIQKAYTKNLTLKIGRCNARKYMSLLLPVVLQRTVPLTDIITHRLPLAEAIRGYEIFQNRKEGAIKVLLTP
jgi:2-desacetyl-2-hydroxyethyl bacteriochlorophyllide A dehydrogenase